MTLPGRWNLGHATIWQFRGARKGLTGKSGESPARSRHCERLVASKCQWGLRPAKVGAAWASQLPEAVSQETCPGAA